MGRRGGGGGCVWGVGGWVGGGWLWLDGVLQGSRAQQEALAVITRWATRSRRYCHGLHNLPTSFSSQLVSTGTLDNIKATCQALRLADSLGPQGTGQA